MAQGELWRDTAGQELLCVCLVAEQVRDDRGVEVRLQRHEPQVALTCLPRDQAQRVARLAVDEGAREDCVRLAVERSVRISIKAHDACRLLMPLSGLLQMARTPEDGRLVA